MQVSQSNSLFKEFLASVMNHDGYLRKACITVIQKKYIKSANSMTKNTLLQKKYKLIFQISAVRLCIGKLQLLSGSILTHLKPGCNTSIILIVDKNWSLPIKVDTNQLTKLISEINKSWSQIFLWLFWFIITWTIKLVLGCYVTMRRQICHWTNSSKKTFRRLN